MVRASSGGGMQQEIRESAITVGVAEDRVQCHQGGLLLFITPGELPVLAPNLHELNFTDGVMKSTHKSMRLVTRKPKERL